MIFPSESDLTSFAEHLGASLRTQPLPLCLELVGDVGAGKTTFTRALARGLGITEPVTSPSFTISKRYPFGNNFLAHYDFYRLQEPGLMAENLNESLNDPSVLTIIEWANTVKNILPKNHQTITFKTLPDGSRELIFDDSVIWDDSCSEISPNPQTPAVRNTTITKRDRGDVVDERRTDCCISDDCAASRFSGEERQRRRTRTNSEQESSEVPSTASEPFSLYLDTSNFTAKINLTDASGKSWEYNDNLGREMAEKLLETLENHLKDHSATFRDLEKITFMSGPGSFTGLRIGACLVNTLSHELHIPLYDHKGTRHQIILPDYGRPANISKPKK